MVQLDKMSLQGVRSFDPDKCQWIKFHPLTLILGVNGAGKTSIIEALRFVTSGEFPPGSNGGKLWIHDPLLQKRGGVVRAQVKLRLKDTEEAITITKILELTTRRGPSGKVTQTLKSQDAHIKKGSTGVSARCADINAELLSIVNVSKAVLTNVIFCHQEDNCWPLSEGKVLKEKFDQIFGSMEYVKALAKIKKFRADKVQKTKELKAVQEMYNEIASNKKKSEERKKSLQERLDILRAEKTAKESAIGPLDEEAKEITKKESELNVIIGKISGLKAKLDANKRELYWMEETIKKPTETTVEEIQAKQDEFEESMRKEAGGLAKVQTQITGIASKIKSLNEEIKQLEKRKGTLEYKISQNENYGKQRKNAILKAQNILGSSCDSTEIVILKQKLNEELRKFSSQEESDPRIVELEKELRECETQKAVVLKEIEMKQKAQSKREMELTHLTSELTKIESPAAKILEDSNLLPEKVDSIRSKLDDFEFFDSVDTILDRMKLNNYDLSEAIFNLKRSYNAFSKESVSLVSELRKKVKNSDDRIKELRKELSELQQSARTKKEENRKQRTAIDHALSLLSSCPSDLSSSEEIDDEIKEINTKQKELQNSIEKYNEEKDSLENQRAAHESESSNKKLIIRQFEDQKRMIILKGDVEKLEKELAEQEKNHGVIDINALAKKKRELDGRRTKIANEIGTIRGQMEQINSEIKQLDMTLREKKYQKAEKELKAASISLITNELLCDDLNTYYKVLDKAITSFHLRQMESINELIGHFWRITYQGGDIDTIKIACDEDDGRSAEAKRRNYNYRVVMIKNNVELDMRGRCSAGQKVLASLVIRIALAQLFCKTCSILTLDEPTTNLDKSNIEFLAKAIHGIVEDQKGKLQIVIITHDEEFLKYIDSSVCDEYFEVFKEDGYSQIISRSITERE